MSTLRQIDLFEGRRLRDSALEAVEFTAETREEWVARARAVALEICAEQGQVTSDDVQRRIPVPEAFDPRILGAVFNARQRGFPFVKVGYVQTTQKQAHARPIPVWKFKAGT